jgi:transcriptional regulator with XRE-family HTH domain
VTAISREPGILGDRGESADAHQLGLHRHLLVSERLRLRRRQLGLTQKEVVARLRRLGVETTNKALSSLEHGAGLDVCKLPELAQALDCTLTYLVGLSSDPLRWEPDGAHWPRERASVTELAAVQPQPSARHGAALDARDLPGTQDQPAGPWILGPVSGLRRRR